MAAMYQTTIPWCTVIVRNDFGVAGAAHQNGARLSCATPGRRGAGARCRWKAASRRPTAPTSTRRADPKAKLDEIEERLNKLRSPFRSAEAFWIEEIIDPRDTRTLLCEFADLAAPVRGAGEPHWMRP